MSGIDAVAPATQALAQGGVIAAEQAADVLARFLAAPAAGAQPAPFASSQGSGVVVGELLALADQGLTALVIDPGCPNAPAVRARTAIDLHGAHLGKPVVLTLEEGDPTRPIVIGVLRTAGSPLAQQLGLVEISADGQRLVVSAMDQVSLRCGKASITLTSAGKVLIEGTYVLSRSSGANRLKGGSVGIN